MPKRAAPPATEKKAPAPRRPRKTPTTATKAAPKRPRKTPSADGDDTKAAPAATPRKKPTRLFPLDPTVTRRVLAFDVGIVNPAYAVVTLTGADDLAIESLGSSNIMHDDPPGGPPTDDEMIAAAVAAGPRRRRRRGEPAPLPPPKPKGRGAKEALKVLTERLTAYLWARADRLLGRRPHAVVIEQQAKKALRLSALGAVIHSFVLNYYLARGEEVPPVFMQSGRQKLRVVFRSLPSSSTGGIADWCTPTSTAGCAPRLMARFRVVPPPTSAITTTTRAPRPSAAKTIAAADDDNNNNKKGEPTAAAKSKAERKQAEGVMYRANKKHAVDNFAPILAHYPGCRRWKPLFDRCKKKDDLADAAMHAIFMLKAGGTRLARTKDLDDASLIVLPARPDANVDDEDGVEKKPRRRRPGARASPSPTQETSAAVQEKKEEREDDIIDLVHYATDPASSDSQDDLSDDDDLLDPSDAEGADNDTDSEEDSADDSDDDDDDDDDFAEPVPKRSRYASSQKSTTTRPTATPFSDSDQSDTDDDDDDSWATDMGICPAPSAPTSPVQSHRD